MDTQTEAQDMIAAIDRLWYALARKWRQSLVAGDPIAASLRESLDLIWSARTILNDEKEGRND